MKRKSIAGLIAIAALLAAAMLAGCVEKEAAIPPIDNQAFKHNCVETFGFVSGRLEPVVTALDNGDVRSAKRELKSLKTLVKIEIMDLNDLKVTEEVIPIKQEMLAFLDDTYSTAEYLENYIDTQEPGEDLMFKMSIEHAMAHGARVVQMAEDL